MATYSDRIPIMHVPTFNGDTGLVLPFREKDSQTFVKGDLVFVTANAGTVELCGADPTLIMGIAMDNATNVTSAHQYIPIKIIRPADLWLMNIVVATAAALVQFGDTREIVRTSAGVWEIETANEGATLSRVRILAPAIFDSVGAIAGVTGGFVFGRTAMGRPDLATLGTPVYVKFIEASGATTGILQFNAPAQA